jgi:hypothetical protein
LYTITVLIFAINCAIESSSAPHPRIIIIHNLARIRYCPANETLLINEVTNAMILSGVDLYPKILQEFLLLRQFFVSSKHHACRYKQLVCFFI